jgi:exodeoxyribonuclease VII large subunit
VSALLRRSGQRVDELQGRLLAAVRQGLARERQRTAVLTARLAPRSLRSGLAEQRQRLRAGSASLRRVMEQAARARRQRLERLAGRMHDLSPLAVLDRGYALARLADTGQVLRDARQARPGQEIEVRLGRGGLGARIESVRPADEPA